MLRANSMSWRKRLRSHSQPTRSNSCGISVAPPIAAGLAPIGHSIRRSHRHPRKGERGGLASCRSANSRRVSQGGCATTLSPRAWNEMPATWCASREGSKGCALLDWAQRSGPTGLYDNPKQQPTPSTPRTVARCPSCRPGRCRDGRDRRQPNRPSPCDPRRRQSPRGPTS
jgi:hypothetical protein